MKKRTDFIVGMLFAAATVILIVIFMTNDAFFNWAFARHRNILSWYIRPLFIIPMVIFAFKRAIPEYLPLSLPCLQACSGSPTTPRAIRRFWSS